MPFAKLVEELAPTRNLSRNPLFQVCFALENTPPGKLQLPGLEVQVIKGIRDQTAKFDLHFSVAEEQGKINVVVEYATDLFDASTIERMTGHWRGLLGGVAADTTQAVSRVPPLTAAGRPRLLRQAEAP